MIIPKVIHQIWEEKTTLPESFYQFSETWKEHHPSINNSSKVYHHSN